MKKPLPVKIVEAIGWIYVALMALWVVILMAMASTASTFDWPGVLIGGSIMLSLPVSMVFSLRTGQRFGFVVPNTVVFSFSVFLSSFVTTSHINLVWTISSLILVIVPEVLLCLPSSRRWMSEKVVESTKGRGPLCTMVIRSLPLLPVVLLVLLSISLMCGV